VISPTLLGYADNAVILSDEGQANDAVQNFSATAAPFGLKVWCAKTKVRNLGSGPQARMLSINSTQVEGVGEFLYLGSKQSSDGYCLPDVCGCIGLASALMV